MECKICNLIFDNKNGLSKHITKTHKIKIEDYTLQYIHNGIPPTCACGCGTTVNYNPEVPYTYRTYASGHYAYHHPDIWGNKSDPERLAKGAAKYRERYAKGEIKHWSKGKTKETDPTLKKYSELFKKENSPERAKRISNKLKGKRKSEEHTANWKSKMAKYWESEEYRERLSDSHIKHLIDNHKHFTSKLEHYFIDNYLVPNNIEYKQFHYIQDIKRFYDLYLPDHNILIETDGDYWHHNPDVFPDPPKHSNIIRNISVDKVKNEWAENNNIILLRFWENDIYKNPELVKDKMRKAGLPAS